MLYCEQSSSCMSGHRTFKGLFYVHVCIRTTPSPLILPPHSRFYICGSVMQGVSGPSRLARCPPHFHGTVEFAVPHTRFKSLNIHFSLALTLISSKYTSTHRFLLLAAAVGGFLIHHAFNFGRTTSADPSSPNTQVVFFPLAIIIRGLSSKKNEEKSDEANKFIKTVSVTDPLTCTPYIIHHAAALSPDAVLLGNTFTVNHTHGAHHHICEQLRRRCIHKLFCIYSWLVPLGSSSPSHTYFSRVYVPVISRVHCELRAQRHDSV